MSYDDDKNKGRGAWKKRYIIISSSIIASCHRSFLSGTSPEYIIIIITIIITYIIASCHRPFLPGTSLEPAVIPTAQASSFTLQ
jgi:hypothetical protein